MFKNPFSFEGRIRRSEYGITFIIVCIANALINVIVKETNGDAGFLYVGFIPSYWLFWAQGAKRCHDLGNSGWWQLIPFYPLWMIFQDGKPGSNEYGNNPKDPNNSYFFDEKNGPNGGSGSGYSGYDGGHNKINNPIERNNTERNDGSYNGNLYN